MLKAKCYLKNNFSLIMHLISHMDNLLLHYGSQGYRTKVHFSAVFFLLCPEICDFCVYVHIETYGPLSCVLNCFYVKFLEIDRLVPIQYVLGSESKKNAFFDSKVLGIENRS